MRSTAGEIAGKYILIAGGAATFFAFVGMNLWSKYATCVPGTFGALCTKQWHFGGVTFHSGRELAILFGVVAFLCSVIVVLVVDNQQR